MVYRSKWRVFDSVTSFGALVAVIAGVTQFLVLVSMLFVGEGICFSIGWVDGSSRETKEIRVYV